MWVSNKIHYEEVRIKKKTCFGYRRKKGYRLTKDLRWRHKDRDYYILRAGYVWDGPSYVKILEWFIGKRKLKGVLAASAFHDTAKKIPAYNIINNPNNPRGYKTVNYYVRHDIRSGAKMYDKMLNAWPDQDETIKGWQSTLQKIGLIIFQPVYSFATKSNKWKIDE